MSAWNTARMVRDAGGRVCPRTMPGAATSAAVARPPLMMVRRANFVMSPSLAAGRFADDSRVRPLSHARAGAATLVEGSLPAKALFRGERGSDRYERAAGLDAFSIGVRAPDPEAARA